MYQVKRKGGAGHHTFDLREVLKSNDAYSRESDLCALPGQNKREATREPKPSLG
ncbi:MAG: hypothetical protein QOJ19_2683 [Acidimicrobiia bacterium]|nr:hypothetical protein [Acidimicrobiia bacterium]